ncbi:MAG TPA: signal recognition particle-docking protein FtsY, partial [Thermoplasmatales archaeon]|nr:signal recognition particle-docking protein FtsY [Thermoplasmatales archaeon]
IDGVILTKVDADAKGGAALSIAYTIGKPLFFIGVGQGYDDQIPFDPEWMIKNIFGEKEAS